MKEIKSNHITIKQTPEEKEAAKKMLEIVKARSKKAIFIKQGVMTNFQPKNKKNNT